jgi:hypothetical protein
MKACTRCGRENADSESACLGCAQPLAGSGAYGAGAWGLVDAVLGSRSGRIVVGLAVFSLMVVAADQARGSSAPEWLRRGAPMIVLGVAVVVIGALRVMSKRR